MKPVPYFTLNSIEKGGTNMNILIGLFCLIFMCSTILLFASIAIIQQEKQMFKKKNWKS